MINENEQWVESIQAIMKKLLEHIDSDKKENEVVLAEINSTGLHIGNLSEALSMLESHVSEVCEYDSIIRSSKGDEADAEETAKDQTQLPVIKKSLVEGRLLPSADDNDDDDEDVVKPMTSKELHEHMKMQQRPVGHKTGGRRSSKMIAGRRQSTMKPMMRGRLSSISSPSGGDARSFSFIFPPG